MTATVAEIFAAQAQMHRDQPFLMLVSDTAQRYEQDPGTITYGEAQQTIQVLQQQYLKYVEGTGQAKIRVALGLDNRPEFFYHWIALNALGVSVVPLNPAWRSGELEYVLEHSDAQLAVALTAYLPGLQHVAPSGCRILDVADFADDDTGAEFELSGVHTSECALLYTSGTTGRPKGCMLSNEYFVSTGQWYCDLDGYCKLDPGKDRLITPLPMYHMNAMAVSTMAMIMTGSCIVPLDRFHPDTWWQSIRECDATIMHYLGVMPAMLMGLPEVAADAEHNIRFGFGAGLSGELHTAFEARFNMQLIEAWAMTETGCTVAVIANNEPRKVGTACFGRPPEHMDYRLVNDDGLDVEPGVPGELLVRRRGDQFSYGFFSGYLKDEAATKEAWRGDYFHTGDLVYLDEDGLMHFVDRKKNVIRRSGENISAVEVEEIIMEHPDVLAVGVAAVPDELRGDEVCACVVLREDAEFPALPTALVEHCLGRLAYFKAPGYVVQIDQLPLTATEKVQRAELKALAAQMVANQSAIDTREMKRGHS